jgi:hypothetical protein
VRANRFAAFAALLVAATTGAVLIAQVRPVQPPTPLTPPSPLRTTHTTTSKKETITVEGCLHGTFLEPATDDLVLDLYKASAYELEISKGMRERLKGHEGHAERVTGTLTVPADPDRLAGTKQIGSSTRIVAAVGSTSPSQTGVPGIAVTKVEHLWNTCAALGKRDNLARDGSAVIGPAAK